MTTLTPASRPSTPAAGSVSARTRRAGAYVVGLVWGVPLLAFTLTYLVADDTGSPDVTDRGLVLFGAVFAACLLIPLGLLALLAVAFLAGTWRGARPIVLAAVSTGAAL